jgi:hypothetical protein
MVKLVCQPQSLPGSGLGEEFVFVNNRGHGYFALGTTVVDPHHFALAADTDALGQGDFRGEGESEFDGRSRCDRRIHVKADAAGTYVAGLRRFFLRAVFIVGDGDGQTEGKAASCPLFVLGFGHESSNEDCKHGVFRPVCQDCTLSAGAWPPTPCACATAGPPGLGFC